MHLNFILIIILTIYRKILSMKVTNSSIISLFYHKTTINLKSIFNSSPSDHEVVRPICTISTCNIIAFSSPTELDDTEGDTWGGHVYVCDLDTPWNCHKVTSTAYPVSYLNLAYSNLCKDGSLRFFHAYCLS